MTDILIRAAMKSDLQKIEKLMAELIETMEDTEGIDIKLVGQNCRDLLSDANSYFLVAEIEGAVVGFINFTTRNTILHPAPSGLIDELVIAKKYRGKGIGKQLLITAIEKCKQFGCCEVEVSTETENTKAREFYKKCGFEEVGVLFEVDLKSME